MKELKFEELTTKQKLGLTMIASLNTFGDENFDYTIELIKNHCVGAIWVNPRNDYLKIIAAVKEAADYPIAIMCDAESGIGEYLIGRHNALASTGSEELAYTFGKITAVTARKMGYNIICNPVLDMTDRNCVCGGTVRSMGGDKYKVASLAKSEARGMHDGGVLTVGKHYPGKSETANYIDSHMGETSSVLTKEELLDYNLYPYLELMKEGLLDGIMTKHSRFVNIDPDYPASLSKKVIGIIKEAGYNGFVMTDALNMMGVVAKFGEKESRGLAIAGGNDFALTWCDNRFGYGAMCESYDKGIISDERLDEAVKKVLETQHKVFAMEPKYTELTDVDIANYSRINTDSVYARTDDGVPTGISKDGKHFFAVLSPNGTDISSMGKVSVDPNYNGWYNPAQVVEKLEAMFPNSKTFCIDEFPPAWHNMRVLDQSLDCEDVIFITFFNSQAYIGTEALTTRIVSLMNAMQVSGRISTVVHFGNPYVLEDLPHIPRVIIGTTSAGCLDGAINVLAGNYPAKGVLTYDVKLK